MTIGGIVLCGGKSSRMGYPKARLPFGAELMLPRVVRILSEVVDPVVVVAAVGQELPSLPDHVRLVHDRRESRGPLEGLLAGMSELMHSAVAAYVTSCDVPLITPAFIWRLVELLGDDDIVVPVEEGFAHPLAAVYRTSLVGSIAELLAAERLRPAFLFERARTRRVPVAELRDVDPRLQALSNLNDRRDYELALRVAGFTAPPELLALLPEATDPEN